MTISLEESGIRDKDVPSRTVPVQAESCEINRRIGVAPISSSGTAARMPAFDLGALPMLLVMSAAAFRPSRLAALHYYYDYIV